MFGTRIFVAVANLFFYTMIKNYIIYINYCMYIIN